MLTFSRSTALSCSAARLARFGGLVLARFGALVLALSIAGLGGALAASGQQDPGAPADQAEGAAPPPAAPAPPPSLASPRATLETFLTSFRNESTEQALSTLDLSSLPARLDPASAKSLIVQLKDIIDRTAYVDYEEIPGDSQGPPYVFLRRPEGEVTLAADRDGAWRFTAATVESIPDLWRATEDLALVEGVREAERTPGLWLRSKVPPSWRQEGFLLEHWQWAGLVLLILLGVVLDRLLSALLEGFVAQQLGRRLLATDGAVLRRGLRPWGLLAMALTWRLGLILLNLPPRIYTILALAAGLFAIAAVVWGAYRLVDIFAAVLEIRAAKTTGRFDDLLVPLVRKTLKIFVAAFGLVFVADNLQIEISSLLAGLGLGGLAFALAAQDLVKNLFGSLMVLMDRPFHVGDWVKVGDVEGTVEEVGFRSTRVRTFYDSLITLPNSNLISAAVDNFGARTYRRWSTKLSITYDTPPDKIEAFTEGVRELIRRHPYTRKDGFHVYLNSFDAASLGVLLYVFWDAPDWATELRERHRLAVDILRLSRRLGVELAFPTQTLYLRREDWETPTAVPEEGYRERIEEALESGRSTARRLVEADLEGRVPPPVETGVPPEQNRGES